MQRNRIVIIFVAVLAGLLVFWLINGDKVSSLVSPNSLTEKVEATPTPEVNNIKAPKEVIYDSSTDLNAELESINPQVLDSDFESLP